MEELKRYVFDGEEYISKKSLLKCLREISDAVNYGMRWQKLQMLKEVVEGEVENAINGTLKEPPKIKGWVARDGDLGHLRLYPSKPWRGAHDYEWGCGYPCMQFLDDNLFPEVTFESSPIEVELLFRQVI